MSLEKFEDASYTQRKKYKNSSDHISRPKPVPSSGRFLKLLDGALCFQMSKPKATYP